MKVLHCKLYSSDPLEITREMKCEGPVVAYCDGVVCY